MTNQAPPQMSGVDVLAVLLGFAVLIGGLIACAVTGNWAALVLVLPIGFGLLIYAGRGGRDGQPRKRFRVQVSPGVMLTRRGPRPIVTVGRRRR